MPANYQQNNAPVRRRALLVILLVAALALTTVYAREGTQGPLHAVQGQALSLISPLAGAGGQVGALTHGAATAASDALADDDTLSALREQNLELRQMVAEAEEYRLEAERLADLLDMKRVAGVKGQVAHITGRSATAWDQSITIDLGKTEGVEAGMTVLGTTGVIGQVVRVYDGGSVVRLLTDPNSGAAVKIQSSRADGVVRGSITGLLYLEDLEEDVIPEVGDVVITSGLGGSYASGLIVGTVVSVNKTTGNASGDIVVSPNASAYMLEEVIVVMDEPPAAQESPDAEGADAGLDGTGAVAADGGDADAAGAASEAGAPVVAGDAPDAGADEPAQSGEGAGA